MNNLNLESEKKGAFVSGFNKYNDCSQGVRARQFGVRYMLMRGGTSKGLFFLKSDLPGNWEDTQKFILAAMGSPDPSGRQINGLGGGDSLSSKVAIIEKSNRPDADIDYLFCQVNCKTATIEKKLSCGNLLSAVAPFALEFGLIEPKEGESFVRIFCVNTCVIVHATVKTPNGMLTYEGSERIDGVPGSGSPIKLNFINAVGSKTKKLLPTGHAKDIVEGVEVSCVDVAVPMVIVKASCLGLTGIEGKEDLNEDAFLFRLEKIRKAAALLMGLGDVAESTMPKICIVSAPRGHGTVTSRYFDPFKLHPTHAVSGALCLASSCLIPGTVSYEAAALKAPNNDQQYIAIEHPSGTIGTHITRVVDCATGNIDIPEASFIRTARALAIGEALVPAHALNSATVHFQTKKLEPVSMTEV